jgi:flavodoxin
MKTLVAFYSRTGNTRRLAQLIATAVDAEVEEINDRANRSGFLGYLRSGWERWHGRGTELAPARHDPAAFDLVIIGTPVWQAAAATPVRSYLQDHAMELPDVAFFCTHGGMGSRYAFRELEDLCGKSPRATLACTERQLVRADLGQAVATFAAQLRSIDAGPEARTHGTTR